MASRADPQADILEFLSQADAFGAQDPPRRIDTHAASVFLVGDRAWKLKRAVRFGYLDFSTPELRRAALEAELRLNRRTAADLYIAVHAISRDQGGRFAISGAGEPVDWLLEMRRFPDDGLLQHVAEAGALDESLLMRLADRLAAFHGAAAVATGVAGADAMRRIVQGNQDSMARFPGTLEPHRVRELAVRLLALIDAHASRLDARARAGRVRHGHGDLHLANIALIDGEPTPFDCLEFSVELATIDVLYDLAFVLMDLWQRGLRVEANMLFNRYLDLSPADEAGIGLMPLFMATRAAIRAHVLAAKGEPAADAGAMAQAAHFLDSAFELLAAPAPQLVAIGGLSGSGKSTLARHLGGLLGRTPGARVVRSDVLRKRLAGAALPETRLPAGHYSADSSARVYAALGEGVAAAVASGQAAIADAVFAKPEEREAIAAVARGAGIPFRGIWLDVPLATRLARLRGRAADASDADAAVARWQESMAVGEMAGWCRLAATDDAQSITQAAHHLLGLSMPQAD